MFTGIEGLAPQIICASSDASTAAAAASNSTHTTTLSYPDYSGGHPPLRGSPDYPYGHPGYFNGTHAGQCPGYTGGATDSYGMYSGAGGMAADPNSTSSLTAQHTSMLGQNAYGFDNKAPDFVWQRGYSWCGSTPNASSGCATYNSQLAVIAPAAMTQEEPPATATAKGASGLTAAASPGHLLLCGHAALLGAWTATSSALAAGDAKAWTSDFRSSSAAAAAAVSPVGGAQCLRSLLLILLAVLLVQKDKH